MMLWLALACGGTDPAPKPAEDSPVEPIDLPEVGETEWGDVTEPDAPVTHTRQLKRMSVAQVRDSMERITGGIPWGEDDASDWDAYAETLGVADYQLRVASDLSPSVMFQKFLDDAAGATCSGWIAAEGSAFHSIDDPTSTARADVRTNVMGLRWKVQGRDRVGTDPVVDDYEDLFTKVHQRTGSTETAWVTVCVAMFTHPDFYMY